MSRILKFENFGGGESGLSPLQTVNKKLFSPFGGRIALSVNEKIAEFLDFTIQAKFAYVNKPERVQPAQIFILTVEPFGVLVTTICFSMRSSSS